MLTLLELWFRQPKDNLSSDEKVGKVISETKKCMNCLRRIEVHLRKCPHCRCSDFIYG